MKHIINPHVSGIHDVPRGTSTAVTSLIAQQSAPGGQINEWKYKT